MGVVTKDELITGTIYVTRGGLITMPGASDPIPWGYERVKFVKIAAFGKSEYIEVETPWDSICHLPLDYPLESTGELKIRQEFSLRGQHISRETIPFAEALTRGICSEEAPPPKKVKVDEEIAPIDVSDNPEKKEFLNKVVAYFATIRNLTVASTHFKVTYQKMRHTVHQLLERGYNSTKFELKKGTTRDGKPGIQLIKVK